MSGTITLLTAARAASAPVVVVQPAVVANGSGDWRDRTCEFATIVEAAAQKKAQERSAVVWNACSWRWWRAHLGRSAGGQAIRVLVVLGEGLLFLSGTASAAVDEAPRDRC
eukprot:TRINITY_DN1119_c0_g1_i2.p2 TRINITY_DN1119_c0_g1~~TRINITY_DN1119_c0_g1_i2.p2  ORF type:complete len:111 (+),score=18.27 TRINITY_DN1119_c0_g1_i2:87-419(+)